MITTKMASVDMHGKQWNKPQSTYAAQSKCSCKYILIILIYV